MNKSIIFSCLLLMSVSVKAQVTLTNAKPMPGDKVSFTYTPPAGVFAETDKITCVAYKWGTYFEGNDWKLDYRVRNIPVDVTLTKIGNHYVGTVPTDSMTRMISFSFTSGEIKWKLGFFKDELISGKIDKYDKEGYAFPFYQADGSVCAYSYFLKGIAINNPRTKAEYFLKELELFPSARYYALEYLIFAYREYDQELMKSVAAKETEKLYAGGLKSWEDLILMANISGIIGNWNQYNYFDGKAKEKAKESQGALPTLANVIADFQEEKDDNRKQVLLEKAYSQYSRLKVEELLRCGDLGSVHMVQRGYILGLALDPEKTDVFKKYIEKTNFYKAVIPDQDDVFFFGMMMDSLLNKKKSVQMAESLLLDLHAFYTGVSNNLSGGKPSTTAFPGERYFTQQDKANAFATMAALVSDCLTRLYTGKGDDKTAWKYAMDSKRYSQRITTQPHQGMNEWASRYCALAEKFSPADDCRADLERYLSAGIWKADMVEILKRLWVKKNKSEAGFEAYLKTLKKGVAEDARKEAMSKQVNYPAPPFALKDLDGNEVSLQSLAGKTVILDFWATWCGPCKASFPAMQTLVNQYKNNPNVKFLFMDTMQKEKSIEEIHKKVSDFIQSKNYTFQVLLDNESKVSKDYKVTAIPTKIVIDKKGNVRYNLVGSQTDEGKLLDEMEAMIESVQ